VNGFINDAGRKCFRKQRQAEGQGRDAVGEQGNLKGGKMRSKRETFRVGIRKEIRQTVLVSACSFDYNLRVIIKKER